MPTGGLTREDAHNHSCSFGARVSTPPETKNDVNGWATVQLTPTVRMPLRNGYLLTMFVRARKEGGDLLAGISTRPLVALRAGAPAA